MKDVPLLIVQVLLSSCTSSPRPESFGSAERHVPCFWASCVRNSGTHLESLKHPLVANAAKALCARTPRRINLLGFGDSLFVALASPH